MSLARRLLNMLNHSKLTIYFFSIVIWLIGSITLTGNAVSAENSSKSRLTLSRELLQEGALLYQQGAFVAARDIWSKSASVSAQQGDILSEALALNNLALVNQRLGSWDKSSVLIGESLNLLEQENIENEPGYWAVMAKIQNTQGNWQLQTGRVEEALVSWQAAANYYQQANDKSGLIKAQINRAKALQALGSTVRAVELLDRVDRQIKQNPDLQAANLRYLGVGLQNLGKLERAVTTLQKSIELAESPQAANIARLELGNTYRQKSDRARTINKDDLAGEYVERAIEAYAAASQSDSVYLQARLNQLSLLVEQGNYDRAELLLQEFLFPTDLEPTRNNIYALLNYAHSLTCLRSPNPIATVCQGEPGSNSPAKLDSEQITSLIERAIAQARTIKDTLAEAQALSQLAELCELENDYKTAKAVNQQALLLLEGKSAPDLTYHLEWQLGRILRQEQQIDAATAAYQEAIANLERVRDNIVFIDPQAQFSFRDRVEPVYREYAELLLTAVDDSPIAQVNLRQAVRAIDALQLAELENFLGCDLSQLIELDEMTVDNTAAQIYPLVLSDRLITIIEIPNRPLIYRETKVERSQVEAIVNKFQTNLIQPARTPEVIELGQQIYQWAIAPLEPILAENPQIKTLVMLPDGLLRNVPFAALYDGEQYLLEKGYTFAISPRLELFAPSPSPDSLKVLTGGVELAQTIEGIAFPPIVQVKEELDRIATEVNTNDPPLLNEAFTADNIQKELERGQFSAIHWKTHGVFSSDPAETFLVAYQDSIKANSLQSLVQTASQGGEEPLELLVLSACETARGDSRAILGLAGLTVRTGARTALSSYWRADDRATTLLMTYFYRQLDAGATKAEALRQAQLYLLQEEGYFAPHYWGTYVLVGNWL